VCAGRKKRLETLDYLSTAPFLIRHIGFLRTLHAHAMQQLTHTHTHTQNARTYRKEYLIKIKIKNKKIDRKEKQRNGERVLCVLTLKFYHAALAIGVDINKQVIWSPISTAMKSSTQECTSSFYDQYISENAARSNRAFI
jgi:hypothetical protein